MRLLAALYIFVVATTAFAQEASAKPDRSAEAALREVFAGMEKLKSAHIRIDRVSREEPAKPWMPEGRTELHWRSDGAFRVLHTGSWGDTLAYTSDGTTLLYDPMDQVQGVTLKDAKPTIYECDSALAQRGDPSSPLFYFLAGEKGFDELVAKDGEVVSISDSAIRFKATKIGTVTVYLERVGKRTLPTRIEYDNLDYRKELAKMWAEWGYEVPPDPLDVHTITYISIDKGFPKATFDTTAPKKLNVTDQRAKKTAEKPVR